MSKIKLIIVLICYAIILGSTCNRNDIEQPTFIIGNNKEQENEGIDNFYIGKYINNVNITDDIMATIGTGAINAMEIVGNKIVAVGDNGYIGYSSNNGSTWGTTKYGDKDIVDITVYDDQFYAICVSSNSTDIIYSDNGIVWNEAYSDIAITGRSIAISDNHIVICGLFGKVAYNSDSSFTVITADVSERDLNAIIYNTSNAKFIIGGDSCVLYCNDSNISFVKKAVTISINDIIYDYNKGIYVAVGSDGCAYSSNLTSWTEVKTVASMNINCVTIKSLPNGDHIFVAGRSKTASNRSRFSFSYDGIYWESISYSDINYGDINTIL